jgi:hypothetical protein
MVKRAGAETARTAVARVLEAHRLGRGVQLSRTEVALLVAELAKVSELAPSVESDQSRELDGGGVIW